MPLNEQQRLVATTFGVPMAVMAGAGSGKTHTLKERVANAFDARVVGPGAEPLESIDQLLAITFTEKAALELKSRIKQTLRQRGLVGEALRVDGAWISTIHGMCSRILKENALELRIDPAFQVVADDERASLLDEATEHVLLDAGPSAAGGGGEPQATAEDVEALCAEYGRDSLKAMVADLVGAAARSPEGFDAVVGPRLAPSLASEAESLRADVASWLSAGGARRVGADDVTLAQIEEYLEEIVPGGRGKAAAAAADEVLPWGAGAGLTAAQHKDYCCLVARLAQAARLWGPLERVARSTARIFRESKIEQGLFDNDDLLVEAHRALGIPSVRERYKDRFRLVLVDEFQDTDRLQLDVVKALAGPSGERLCVVGDPEQSIYRFRGADLEVCTDHLAQVERQGGMVVELADNYRSHEDVLDFVDLVFAPEAGEEGHSRYQRLRHARDEGRVPEGRRHRAGEGPRVEVVDVEWAAGRAAAGRRLEAAWVARRLRRSHDASGRPFGQMAILLGKMTHADVYAQALDDAGIPCAVTGGSVLAGKAEAQVMVALARTLANPRDDEAAFGLLASDVFGLDEADLVAMVDAAREQGARGTGVGEALATLLERASGHGDDGLVAALGPSLAAGRVGAAVATLGRAERRLAGRGVARVMEGVLADSGWLARMQGPDAPGPAGGGSVTGQARAANALKVVRMARDLEGEGRLGASSVAEALKRRLESSKEAPGVLSAEGSDFVRIMTIHASKGLQFPVVAVAELDGAAPPRRGRARGCLVDGRTLVSLDVEESLARCGSRMRGCADTAKAARAMQVLPSCPEGDASAADADTLRRCVREAESAGDLAARAAALSALDTRLDDDELERRLYVAFTRAEEELVVCMGTQVRASELEDALSGLPDAGLKADEAVLLSRTSSRKVPEEERAGARRRVAELRDHVNLPLAGEPKGVPGRIRARRDEMVGRGLSYLTASAAQVARFEATGELPGGWDGAQAEERGAFLDYEPAPAAARGAARPAVPVPDAWPAMDAPRLRLAPLARWGLASASALHAALPEDDGDDVPALGPVPTYPLDDDPFPARGASATERGSAFHLLAEAAARRWEPGSALVLPRERLAPTRRLFGLTDAQGDALEGEMATWLGSSEARAMASHAHLLPEVPFFVGLPGEVGRPQRALQGFIDLLAFDEPDGGRAWVVDYKTGRFLDTDAARRAAYDVQARTYAYALLARGFSEVRLAFVFVDQPMPSGEPAVCRFPAPGEPPYAAVALAASLARDLRRARR